MGMILLQVALMRRRDRNEALRWAGGRGGGGLDDNGL